MSAQKPYRVCQGPKAVSADEKIALGPEQWDAWRDDIWASTQSCAVSPVNGERHSEADRRVVIPPENPPTPATQRPKVVSSDPGPNYRQTIL